MDRDRTQIAIATSSDHGPTRGGPTDRGQPYDIGNTAFCWHCRFFRPEGEMPLQEPWTDDTLEGSCCRFPPVVGERIRPGTNDFDRCFANFPLVMAGFWCGEFQPRTLRNASNPPNG